MFRNGFNGEEESLNGCLVPSRTVSNQLASMSAPLFLVAHWSICWEFVVPATAIWDNYSPAPQTVARTKTYSARALPSVGIESHRFDAARPSLLPVCTLIQHAASTGTRHAHKLPGFSASRFRPMDERPFLSRSEAT
ncbi:hypothetical protein INS49_008840 [Diaporthe citri]|uniref:uncharacterized protein n=1 Tax=Diaporthe citri TaxID=83186 RepID=UPI001C7E32AE|nr:uncharacterized protein INS49_008840 [Diaporthe citri]KAG6363737.1 hypothetical protein INS49_008840 [Diaporthe citri]